MDSYAHLDTQDISGPCHSLCCVLWHFFLVCFYVNLELMPPPHQPTKRPPRSMQKPRPAAVVARYQSSTGSLWELGQRYSYYFPNLKCHFPPPKVVFLKSILSKNQNINLNLTKKNNMHPNNYPKCKLESFIIMLVSMIHGFSIVVFFVWSLPISHGARPDSSSRRPPNLEDQPSSPPGWPTSPCTKKGGGGSCHVYI